MRKYILLPLVLICAPAAAPTETRFGIPISGKFVPELVEFDREMARFVRDKKIPGAAVALTKVPVAWIPAGDGSRFANCSTIPGAGSAKKPSIPWDGAGASRAGRSEIL